MTHYGRDYRKREKFIVKPVEEAFEESRRLLEKGVILPGLKVWLKDFNLPQDWMRSANEDWKVTSNLPDGWKRESDVKSVLQKRKS